MEKLSKFKLLQQKSPVELKTMYDVNNCQVSKILKSLGFANDPRARKHVSDTLMTNFNIDTSAKCSKDPNRIDRIINESASCYSITEILHKVGLQPVGANFATVKKVLLDANIILKQRPQLRKWSDALVYCQHSTFPRTHLRKRFLNDAIIPYRCALCTNTGFWNEQILNLQVDHKNGISDDNRHENLRWLCPNCHSQTITFGGKNRK